MYVPSSSRELYQRSSNVLFKELIISHFWLISAEDDVLQVEIRYSPTMTPINVAIKVSASVSQPVFQTTISQKENDSGLEHTRGNTAYLIL